jgi:hypothetical protein
MEKLAREQMPIQTDPLPARETGGTACGGSGIRVGYGDTALTSAISRSCVDDSKRQFCVNGYCWLLFTANVGTEGAVKKFLFWDISEEFPIT